MRQILCIWLCWKTDSLNLKFMDEHLSRIQYRPVHLYRGRPSQKSVLTVVARSGDLYNYQLRTQDLLTSNNSEMGGFSCRIPEKELMSIQNCTRYIRDPAITIKICLLSINIPPLPPFSSLSTCVTTYKNPKP